MQVGVDASRRHALATQAAFHQAVSSAMASKMMMETSKQLHDLGLNP